MTAYPGCDNAPSSMSGHSGRCGSAEAHIALIRQGIGIGPNPTGSSTTARDHGRRELTLRGMR